MKRIAIIGSGVAGLACARRLAADQSLKITIFDKGRHPGGRLASRDRDQNQFDYGAQYFTARSPEFKSVISKMMEAGAVEIWNGRFGRLTSDGAIDETSQEARYVGVPCMRSLAEALGGDLAKSIDLRQHHRVTSIEKSDRSDRSDGFWAVSGELTSADSTEPFKEKNFDCLVITVPPVQATELWKGQNEKLETSSLSPCIAGMFSFNSPLPMEYDGIRIDDSVLAWAARDSSKPGRPAGERWTLHASPQWSQDNITLSEQEALDALCARFFQLLKIDVVAPSFSRYHRWRYALVTRALETPFLIDKDNEPMLAFCGDYCEGARVEAAFDSGNMLAKEILDTLAGVPR
ncbi:MAG: FAD-dependent oxidoreductase [Cyanobacteriota/Melainabacteria group bacterium]